MAWSKVIFILFVNLFSNDFIAAQESREGQPQNAPTVQSSTYTSFPFGLIFGLSNNNSTKNLESPMYDSERDVEFTDFNKARGVYWIPTTCDSLLQRGYTCLGCTESLHCMGGNFALKALCGGRRPYCYNGVCSDLRMDKCRRDNDVSADSAVAASTPTHEHVTNEEIVQNSTTT